MTSSVNFRMHFGKKDEWETILFPGHSIRLLDLKKEIAEKKKILLTNLDFDLQITENETGKGIKICLFTYQHIHLFQLIVQEYTRISNMSNHNLSFFYS